MRSPILMAVILAAAVLGAGSPAGAVLWDQYYEGNVMPDAAYPVWTASGTGGSDILSGDYLHITDPKTWDIFNNPYMMAGAATFLWNDPDQPGENWVQRTGPALTVEWRMKVNFIKAGTTPSDSEAGLKIEYSAYPDASKPRAKLAWYYDVDNVRVINEQYAWGAHEGRTGPEGSEVALYNDGFEGIGLGEWHTYRMVAVSFDARWHRELWLDGQYVGRWWSEDISSDVKAYIKMRANKDVDPSSDIEFDYVHWADEPDGRFVAPGPAPVTNLTLLVGSSLTDQVLGYNGLGGQFRAIFAGSASGLDDPQGIALGPDGKIYVCSAGTDEVIRFDADGSNPTVFVPAGSGGLDQPAGLTFGPEDPEDPYNPQEKRLYVSSRATDEIKRYQGPLGASPGAFVDNFVSAASGGLDEPRGLIFGKDQAPDSAPYHDGVPELLVCSFTTDQILRYDGQSGTFIDAFVSAGYCGLDGPADLKLGPVASAPGSNLFVTSANGNAVLRYSGTYPSPDNFFGVYAEGCGITNPAGLAFGPDTTGDRVPELFIASSGTDEILRFDGDHSRTFQGVFVAAGSGGLDGPTCLLFHCSGNQPVVLEAVSNSRGLSGDTGHVLTISGTNLAALNTVKLVKTRHGGGVPEITGENPTMTGDELQVTFDLTGAEAGRWDVVPDDPCGLANSLEEAVLIYLPELTNGSFEQGYVDDPRDDDPLCDGGTFLSQNALLPKPKHWDQGAKPSAGTLGYYRRGDIWHPDCDPATGETIGITGLHYASMAIYNNANDHFSFFQTIAAPNADAGGITTEAFNIRADFAIKSTAQASLAHIRLLDGTEDVYHVIDDVVIGDTRAYSDGLVALPWLNVVVPDGYEYTSNPPILTIELLFETTVGDDGAKGFHVDRVRTGPFIPPDCGNPVFDADDDTDVDQDDFGVWQACFTGSLTGTPPPLSAECVCFDWGDDDSDGRLEADGDVDLFDYAAFEDCASGPGIDAWDGCDDNE